MQLVFLDFSEVKVHQDSFPCFVSLELPGCLHKVFNSMAPYFCYLLVHFPLYFIYLFIWLLREREGEILMCKRNIDWLPPERSPTMDHTRKPGMCPDWGLNMQPFGAWEDPPTNGAAQLGLSHLFYWDFFFRWSYCFGFFLYIFYSQYIFLCMELDPKGNFCWLCWQCWT